AQWIRSIGAERVTASYDLNREQIFGLVDSIPRSWVEVVIHQHMPMFHMEHCVFCSVLSPGTNKTNCGRPCDEHEVHLRDRVGAEHALHADVACRNTLYNAMPQSGAEIVDELQIREVQWFRIELLAEDAGQTKATVALYRSLLSGEVAGRDVWRELNATNRLGVTRGTLESKRNPLSIL
ncbi:MAG: U32 family peptidase, partial [Rubripirellula sp.]